MPINPTTLVGSAGLLAGFGTAALAQPAIARLELADGANARRRASSPRCSRKHPRASDRVAQRTREPVQKSTLPGTMVDALSDRELHVLRLLASDLSGPEIASELFVSINTFRTHTKRIFTNST